MSTRIIIRGSRLVISVLAMRMPGPTPAARHVENAPYGHRDATPRNLGVGGQVIGTPAAPKLRT